MKAMSLILAASIFATTISSPCRADEIAGEMAKASLVLPAGALMVLMSPALLVCMGPAFRGHWEMEDLYFAPALVPAGVAVGGLVGSGCIFMGTASLAMTGIGLITTSPVSICHAASHGYVKVEESIARRFEKKQETSENGKPDSSSGENANSACDASQN